VALHARAGQRVTVVPGAVALTVIGLSSGMVVIRGKAETTQRASATVVAERTPICIKNFMAASDTKAKLAELTAMKSSYTRESFVRDGKWATINNDAPISGLCSKFEGVQVQLIATPLACGLVQ
jgi:hypothetical protein